MERGRDTGKLLASAGVLVASTVAMALLVKGLYPADLPDARNPDFVDNIFDNRGVLWAARLLMVSAAGVLAIGGVFIVVSIGIRMRNGEWLRRAGPFEISEEPLRQVEGEAGFWRRVALESEKEVADLRERLRHFEELAGNLRSSR